MKSSELENSFQKSQSIQSNNVARNDRVWKPILATFIAALGSLSFGYSLAYSSSAVVDLEERDEDASIRLTSQQASWFSSLVTVGAMFGSLIGGWTIDYLGRKGTVIACVLPFELGWLLIAFGKNHAMLYAGRIICGLACGMVSLSVPVYIAEIVPARLRGMLGSVNQLAVTGGLLLSYVMGAIVNWRWLALIGAMPPALLVIFMYTMPETPRWSLGNNRRSEALTALQWLRGPDADVEEECFTIEETLDRNEELKWSDWLSPVIFKPLVISVGLMVFQQFCGINAVLFNAASIFAVAGFKDGKLVSISVGLIQFFGTALGCLIVDRSGRRILLWTMAIGMCVSLVGLGVYFDITASNTSDGSPTSSTVSLLGSKGHSIEASKLSWLSILCLLSLNLAFSLAWGPLPWLIMSEIFPLRARGPASSIATLSNWLLAFIVTNTYSAMVKGLTIHWTYWVYGIFCFVGFLFVYFFLPETKGKTLEEIEAMFDKDKHAYQCIE
ncbi:solute carrier family 2, facilitated glucose transporter member 8-like isoform X1 [Montipora capricornis]|uniref:solute carrier family 2, facilitated glucose transporter member 8-like isoform X1 n=2 Tax=Montipora capricornis TaxID=246305 RepID=UPI0035F1F1C3